MSLRFMDSFDHYTATADILTKWTAKVGVSTPTISAGNGRNGTACINLDTSENNATNFSKTIDSQQTWIVGFAFRAAAFYSGNPTICALVDAGSNQCDLRLISDGTLRITRNGTTLGTTSFSISLNQYYYIEFKVKIDPSVGTAEVKVNGSSKLALTGQNTRATANSTANQIFFGNLANLNVAGPMRFDDIYICDGQGSIRNDFLGDKRVLYRTANAIGNTTQFSRGGSDSGNNWDQVNEAAPNDDTDYVFDNVVGHKDTYGMENLTQVTGTISGIQTIMRVRKDDAGARSVAATIRTNSTDFDGTNFNPNTTYSYALDIREQNPSNSQDFTITDINNLEMGPKVTA